MGGSTSPTPAPANPDEENEPFTGKQTPFQIQLKKYLKYKKKYLENNQLSWDQKNVTRNVEYGGTHELSNWIHQGPRNVYDFLVKSLGKPTHLSNKQGGIVIWQKKDDIFEEHILRDEEVKHAYPSPHVDFFYSTIKFHVPASKVPLVQSISGSLIIDLLYNTLTARCGGPKANYATLRTAIDVVNSKENLSKDKVTEMYIENINNMKADEKHNLKTIEDGMNRNRTLYLNKLDNSKLSGQYHPYAFNKSLFD